MAKTFTCFSHDKFLKCCLKIRKNQVWKTQIKIQTCFENLKSSSNSHAKMNENSNFVIPLIWIFPLVFRTIKVNRWIKTEGKKISSCIFACVGTATAGMNTPHDLLSLRDNCEPPKSEPMIERNVRLAVSTRQKLF